MCKFTRPPTLISAFRRIRAVRSSKSSWLQSRTLPQYISSGTNLVYLAPRQASPLQWLHQAFSSRSKCFHSPGSHLPYVFIWLQECVDTVHNPAEEPPIEGLRHGVPDVGSPVHRVGSDNGLAPGDHTVGRESLQELFGADAEYTGSWKKRVNMNKREATLSHSPSQPAPTASRVCQAPFKGLHCPDKQGS